MRKSLTLLERASRKGVSLRQIARDTGIHYPTVRSHHSLGHVPSLKYALLYARYYGCSPEAILKGFTKGERT